MKKGIGLYIGQKEVFAASLSSSKGVPVLNRFAIEPITALEEPQSTVEKKKKLLIIKKGAEKKRPPEAMAIAKALEKIGARHGHVAVAFNPFHLVTRYFEMPHLPHKEWKKAATYESARYLPFKLSEVISDYRVGIKGAQTLCVNAVAVRTDLLRTYVNRIREASANVDIVEPVFSAFSRALSTVKALETSKTYGFLFLDSDGSVNITLARNGVVYLSRDFLLAEDRKGNEVRFCEELKVSFDFMKRISGSDQVDRVYIAGSGDLVFWADFLSGAFGEDINFEFGFFAAKHNVPKDILGALLIPIGLALSALKYKSPLGDFSLLPSMERETKPERLKRLVSIEFIISALIFLILRIFVLEPYVFSAKSRAARSAQPQAADPSLASLSAEELQQMLQRYQEYDRQQKLLAGRGISVGSKFRALARALPSSTWLDQIVYTSGDTSFAQESFQSSDTEKKILTLQGRCYMNSSELEIKAINDLAKVLGEDKEFLAGFQKVTVAEVRRDQFLNRETSSFRIVIE